MDQKATSVADISAVLAIQEEEIENGFADGKRGYLTKSARRRRREARKRNEAKANLQSERIAQFEATLSTEKVNYKIAEIKDAAESENAVKILWNDLHNARFAESWPSRVLHGELDLSRDHVMPGQKPLAGVEVLANKAFQEKETAPA
jgi:hypothetical protein